MWYVERMQIDLPKEHEDWLRKEVAAGRFASLEEAVAEAIASLKAEEDDSAWAAPLIVEGLAELDRGESIPAEQVFSRIETRLREKT